MALGVFAEKNCAYVLQHQAIILSLNISLDSLLLTYVYSSFGNVASVFINVVILYSNQTCSIHSLDN